MKHSQTARIFCGMISFLVLSSFLGTRIYAAEGQRLKAAKKEAKVVLYTVMNVKDNEALKSTFEKKYPGIVVEGFRGGSGAVINKVLTEARAGSLKADVIFAGGSEMQVFKKEGLLQKYVSPEAAAIPVGFKDPDGYWTNVHPLMLVTAFNTRLVTAADAPQTYEDLLKPQWKGNMMMDRVEYDWFATLQKVWGRDRTIAFAKKLATQNIKFMTGHSAIAQLVAAGEAMIGINMYAYRVSLLKQKGATIDWVALDPVVAILETVAVTSSAPHPNAARLLVDFMLAVDGQRLIRNFGRIPGRTDIQPRNEELGKIKGYPTDTDSIYERGLEAFGKEYREIFGLQ
ncbi:MAG: extracellular solute-binding protein [Deltaproteobacteria bacterium]|nr:extracellular solute-binding protein [Deltaproteobacteria bacterium]